jgi:ABC-type sugar transport system ATPase subunit
MISSELPELIGMCDRIYIMRDGTVEGCLNRDEFSQERILSVALAPVDKPCKTEVSA